MIRWCFFLFLFKLVLSYKTLYFGGLFDETNTLENEKTFINAVNYANGNDFQYDVNFQTLSEKFSETGPYGALKATCSLFRRQAVVIFGPQNEENIHIVQATCDYKDIPHVIIRWVYKPLQHSPIINFYPHSKYLTVGYLNVLHLWEWKSFMVLYDDNESILRLSELIRDAKEAGVLVSVKKIDHNSDEIYRSSLKEALLSGETRFVLDCRIEILEQVLIHAQHVGLMTSRHSFFITNLDMYTLNWEPFQYSGVNITGMRLVQPESIEAKSMEFLQDLSFINTETALLIDAVQVLAEAIRNHGGENIGTTGVDCNSTKVFRHGATISGIVKNTKYEGLTGLIEFDNEGLRTNFNLDILELHEKGIGKIGTWNHSKGISITRATTEDINDDPLSLRNKTFIVITCLTDPYCMLKESPNSLVGNDRFEGFAIDLIKRLGAMEGFNYTFIIRKDKANGSKDKQTGRWSGMIGDVINHVADLAITDLTITSEREEAVDFTSPFMNLGISILAKQPSNAPPGFFSFADPLAIDTWIAIAASYVVVTLSFFIIGRMCPEEWTNPYPCVEEPEYLINQFTFLNAAWYAAGTLLQQGSEIAPIGVSTRMVAGMWWFFILIMVSSYTANLAAFLATENPIELFSDADSLIANLEKHNLRLGAKAKGATEAFFKSQKNDTTFMAIARQMEAHPEDMVGENRFGVAKAEEGHYAFFMEDTGIDYETQRHCTLQQYGTLLDDKGYGIAMRKQSPYRKRLSLAILKLQAAGELDQIKRRWWEEKRGGGQCNAKAEAGGAAALALPNLQGVFFVTIGGTVFAVLFVIIEMLVATHKLKVRANMTFKDALTMELKTIININKNVKAVIPSAKSGSKSTLNSTRKRSPQSFNNNLNYGFAPAILKVDLTNN